jgi:hypothetical protein
MCQDPNSENLSSNSIVQPGQHFRLRLGSLIVGYMNVREGVTEMHLYSKDNAAWTNIPIGHDSKDRSAEILDAKGTMIFEQDLIELRRDSAMEYTKRGVVVWHHIYRSLVVKLIEEDGVLSLDVPDPQKPIRDDLTVISHLF